MTVKLTCDGSVLTNPGPGGWACIMRAGQRSKALYGCDKDTTNNKMELTGAIQGLNHLNRPCEVVLYSDSEYVIKGITIWIKKWKTHNWETVEWTTDIKPKPNSKKPVKNIDLWKELDKATERHRINWQWVRGHNNFQDNLLCDILARRAARLQIGGSANLSDLFNSFTEPLTSKTKDEELIRCIKFTDY